MLQAWFHARIPLPLSQLFFQGKWSNRHGAKGLVLGSEIHIVQEVHPVYSKMTRLDTEIKIIKMNWNLSHPEIFNIHISNFNIDFLKLSIEIFQKFAFRPRKVAL